MDSFDQMMYGSGSRSRAKRRRSRGLSGIRGGKNNFTKKDIVKYCSEETGLSQKVCKDAFDAAIEFIKTFAADTKEKNGKTVPDSCVTIAGFGSFRTEEYTYNTKHPVTGKRYSGKRKKLVFKPSK